MQAWARSPRGPMPARSSKCSAMAPEICWIDSILDDAPAARARRGDRQLDQRTHAAERVIVVSWVPFQWQTAVSRGENSAAQRDGEVELPPSAHTSSSRVALTC